MDAKKVAKNMATNGDVKVSIDTLHDLLAGNTSVEKINKDFIREVIDELGEME